MIVTTYITIQPTTVANHTDKLCISEDTMNTHKIELDIATIEINEVDAKLLDKLEIETRIIKWWGPNGHPLVEIRGTVQSLHYYLTHVYGDAGLIDQIERIDTKADEPPTPLDYMIEINNAALRMEDTMTSIMMLGVDDHESWRVEMIDEQIKKLTFDTQDILDDWDPDAARS